MTATGGGSPDPRRHPEAPKRYSTYQALDDARRREQDAEAEAKRLRQPEPSIFAATYPLPRATMPDERLSGLSSILGLPYEELIWKKTDTEPKLIWRRMKVKIHGWD